MDRWRGLLRSSLFPKTAAAGAATPTPAPQFKVAASLCFSPSSNTLTVPSANAVFFCGDKVENTGNAVIEEMSDARNVAELLVSKLGRSVNGWVVEASTFNGAFAVYREFVPSVDRWGNPARYNPAGFPASSSIAALLSDCVGQVKDILSGGIPQSLPTNVHSASSSPPRTVVLGFSKGGTVLNQLLTELAQFKSGETTERFGQSYTSFPITDEHVVPRSRDAFLRSISEFHYLDVGLNCPGAYITDHDVIKKIGDSLSADSSGMRFVFHGTPRQWCDRNRPWIRKEKDRLLHMLEDKANISRGKLHVTERFYFDNMPPTLQMHYEVIKNLDVS